MKTYWSITFAANNGPRTRTLECDGLIPLASDIDTFCTKHGVQHIGYILEMQLLDHMGPVLQCIEQRSGGVDSDTRRSSDTTLDGVRPLATVAI